MPATPCAPLLAGHSSRTTARVPLLAGDPIDRTPLLAIYFGKQIVWWSKYVPNGPNDRNGPNGPNDPNGPNGPNDLPAARGIGGMERVHNDLGNRQCTA